jgi:hypothetical protein
MKQVQHRLRQLENRLAPPPEKCIRYKVMRADRELALDPNTCVDILEECGFLLDVPMSVVHLARIPDGLNAIELKKFLREHGDELV